jgi:hypothetical protein
MIYGYQQILTYESAGFIPNRINPLPIIQIHKRRSKFFAYYFLKVQNHRKSQNSRNQGFSYFFCLLMAGSVQNNV